MEYDPKKFIESFKLLKAANVANGHDLNNSPCYCQDCIDYSLTFTSFETCRLETYRGANPVVLNKEPEKKNWEDILDEYYFYFMEKYSKLILAFLIIIEIVCFIIDHNVWR